MPYRRDLDNLRAYFNALFIDSYNFPELNDVKLLVTKFQEKNKEKCDEILLALQTLIFELGTIKKDMTSSASRNDLGYFRNQISNYKFMKYFPIYPSVRLIG